MKTNLLNIQRNWNISFQKEKLFLVLALVAIGFFFVSFMRIGMGSSLQSKNPIVDSGINYKMAHAEDGYSGFSLADREIDYQYEALKKKQAEDKKIISGRIQVPAVTKKVEDKKAKAQKTAEQKMAEAKKDQINKQILQKALVEHAKKEQAKKVYESMASQYSNNVAYDNSNQENSQANSQTNEPDNKKNHKSFSEWRALIYANPTQETMMKFIEAFRKGEISPEDYQSMAQDLLDQNSDSLKGLGLMALRANPSLQSLSEMVHVENSLSAQLKTYVQQGYNSYLQGQNINILNQALKTTDKILVKRTLAILQNGIGKINSGDVTSLTSGGRSRGGSGAGNGSSFSINNFKILLTALTALTTSNDVQIASLARQVSGQISSSTSYIAGL